MQRRSADCAPHSRESTCAAPVVRSASLMRSTGRVASLAAFSCTFAVLAAACGSSTTAPSPFGSSGGTSGDTSEGGAASPSFGGTSTGSSDADTDTGTCFAPVDMCIVFDRSGSMGDPAGNGSQGQGDCVIGDTKNSKWCHALSAYLGSSAAKDQSAALPFFSSSDIASRSTGTPYERQPSRSRAIRRCRAPRATPR